MVELARNVYWMVSCDVIVFRMKNCHNIAHLNREDFEEELMFALLIFTISLLASLTKIFACSTNKHFYKRIEKYTEIKQIHT